ncbi:MAG TPA: hypothetical protein VH138_14695 [Vicinamibacterales bacterium]|nr:hypothetical protein [Vicinamibacterales bacterium]
MGFDTRHARVRALEALDARAKQFRGREEIWPFRVPHEPLDLEQVAEGVAPEALRGRNVVRLEWPHTAWELWTIALPSGILLYCDSDGNESRVLASVKRGSPPEADGFFLERLAESRGEFFGIEMSGPAPDRVRSSISDREFLADVFVDLFEGTSALPAESPDFRTDVVRWLDRVLTCPPFTRAQSRVADARD